MNPLLDQLQPYPFEKLRRLLADVTPNPAYRPISLGIGEPKHPTPAFIRQALTDHLDGLASYPTIAGSEALRGAIAGWLERRYGLPKIDAATQVLPVNGSREALFALAQAVIDPADKEALVLCPNPFYQIYEGATYLAGAEPYFVNSDPARNFAPDYGSVPEEIWRAGAAAVPLLAGQSDRRRAVAGRLAPTVRAVRPLRFRDRRRRVLFRNLFHRPKRRWAALQAAHQLGRALSTRLIAFSSLSKRSNVPGMRSGFVAGDAAILKKFLLYRTYHGSAMSPAVQAASVAAWNDETHVQENRAKYRAKVPPGHADAASRCSTSTCRTPASTCGPTCVDKLAAISDTEFARRLYAEYNVTVLPGSYLARDAHGVNPGRNRIRMALVAEVEECLEAARRIVEFSQKL